MPAPLQIGYYDDSAGPGGTTRYLLELLAGLPRDELRPVFFAPVHREWHRHLRELDVEVVTLEGPLPAPGGEAAPASPTLAPARRKVRLPRVVAWHLGLEREIRRLEQLFRMRPVELLHTNNCGAEPAPLAARRAGVPRVLGTWHVDSTYDLNGERETWFYRRLERASMRALHHAIAVSEATKQDWLRRCRLGEAYARRVTVVYNGVDLERLRRRRSPEEAKTALGLPPGAPVIGSLGRLEPAKGYTYLIQALPEVLRRHPETRVVIGGRGPLRESLEAEARALGVAHALQWAGFVTDVRDVLEALDLYVQPSLCEALPLSVLEAVVLGMPTVVTRVGGMPEIVNHCSGVVAPPRDSEALARALCSCLATIDSAKNTRQLPPGGMFTRDAMCSQTVAAYRDLLAADQVPGPALCLYVSF